VQISPLEIPDIKLLIPNRFDDDRGFFSEIFVVRDLEAAGISKSFVQENLSRSRSAGTVRGLHFQDSPHEQTKLVRVSRGRMFDVAVDIRQASPTFGKFVGVELSEENRHQLYIPSGFAHGFCTLEPNTEVVYKVSSYYAPNAEGGIFWSDDKLGIPWPVSSGDVIVSEKDAMLPRFEQLFSRV
jgi:dTDP-4-dehydrorhamnose 3,5-epimerase